MKKSIITFMAITFSCSLKAQVGSTASNSIIGSSQKQSTSTKSYNGDPIVNGIPYSQYKAQQEALKKQQEQQQEQQQQALQKQEAEKPKGIKIAVDKPNN